MGLTIQSNPVGTWQSFTPTGSWTNATYTGHKRRVGDSMEYDVALTLSAAPAAATLTITIPETIDTTKLASTALNYELGMFSIIRTGVNIFTGGVYYNNTTSVGAYVNLSSGAVTNPTAVTEGTPASFGNLDIAHFRFIVPIAG